MLPTERARDTPPRSLVASVLRLVAFPFQAEIKVVLSGRVLFEGETLYRRFRYSSDRRNL
jgi:hypothetical protein